VKLVSMALAVLVVAVAAACGGSGDDGPPPTPASPVGGALDVRAFEWGFDPEAIVLERGEAVTITLRNEGDIIHNLQIEGLEASGVRSESTGGQEAGEGELLVWADDGDVGTLTFTPESAGSYEFYCTIGNHRQLGMEGEIEVR
jgi:uncharacterized cupredoxin-like copper-binding protein